MFGCSFNCLPFIHDFKVLQINTCSDHLPIVVYLYVHHEDNPTYECKVSQSDSCKLVFKDSESVKFKELLRWKDEVSRVDEDINKNNDVLITSIKDVAIKLNFKKPSGSG